MNAEFLKITQTPRNNAKKTKIKALGTEGILTLAPPTTV